MVALSQKLLNLCKSDGSIALELKVLVDQLKEQGFGALILLLSIPSALPIPAAGYSTPFGIILALLGLQLIFGCEVPWYPKRWNIKRLSLSKKWVTFACKMLRIVEIFTRPNRCVYLQYVFNRCVIGINIFILSVIMALPIPLTNTLPAAIILLFGVGLLEKDGLFLCFAQVCSMIATSIYVFAAYWISVFGIEGLMKLFS
ncbi:MAG: exopolysaccharide biosynthesis protein [Puniceicoccales bacterium]|nr:exopolysaccharide biosynthesis protein [Puniceicoccales bacterium]